jgi:hypothetical protein
LRRAEAATCQVENEKRGDERAEAIEERAAEKDPRRARQEAELGEEGRALHARSVTAVSS